jgi:hypothetical protein
MRRSKIIAAGGGLLSPQDHPAIVRYGVRIRSAKSPRVRESVAAIADRIRLAGSTSLLCEQRKKNATTLLTPLRNPHILKMERAREKEQTMTNTECKRAIGQMLRDLTSKAHDLRITGTIQAEDLYEILRNKTYDKTYKMTMSQLVSALDRLERGVSEKIVEIGEAELLPKAFAQASENFSDYKDDADYKKFAEAVTALGKPNLAEKVCQLQVSIEIVRLAGWLKKQEVA